MTQKERENYNPYEGKSIDHTIDRIGHLYESAKDDLHSLSILSNETAQYYRLFDTIRELRDIAAVAAKSGAASPKPDLITREEAKSLMNEPPIITRYTDDQTRS